MTPGDAGLDGREGRAVFISAFRCPDPSGNSAVLCYARGERAPEILRSGDGLLPCPLWKELRCFRWSGVGAAKGILPRFVGATLEDARPTPAIAAVRQAVADRWRRWLVLLGPPGSGKTWALSAAVRATPGALFVEAEKFVSDVLDRDRREDAIEEASSASLLAFDDLGRGYATRSGFAECQIEELLCTRHAALAPMVIASNWTPAELTRRLSGRVIDRLRETATIIQL